MQERHVWQNTINNQLKHVCKKLKTVMSYYMWTNSYNLKNSLREKKITFVFKRTE